MKNELYIFSNDPVAPTKSFAEGLESEYNNLVNYLDEKVAVAPSYSGVKKTGIEEIDRYKKEFMNFEFIHVYLVAEIEYDRKNNKNEMVHYDHSHTEFNQINKRIMT